VLRCLRRCDRRKFPRESFRLSRRCGNRTNRVFCEFRSDPGRKAALKIGLEIPDMLQPVAETSRRAAGVVAGQSGVVVSAGRPKAKAGAAHRGSFGRHQGLRQRRGGPGAAPAMLEPRSPVFAFETDVSAAPKTFCRSRVSPLKTGRRRVRAGVCWQQGTEVGRQPLDPDRQSFCDGSELFSRSTLRGLPRPSIHCLSRLPAKLPVQGGVRGIGSFGLAQRRMR
jgi:hypothetical protein